MWTRHRCGACFYLISVLISVAQTQLAKLSATVETQQQTIAKQHKELLNQSLLEGKVRQLEAQIASSLQSADIKVRHVLQRFVL